MLPTPRIVVTGSVPIHRSVVPATPHRVAAVVACFTDKRPVTRGRCTVRFIWASRGISQIWFHADADAEQSAVPVTTDASTAGSVASGKGPAATKPAAVVATTNVVRRALARSAYAKALDRFFVLAEIDDGEEVASSSEKSAVVGLLGISLRWSRCVPSPPTWPLEEMHRHNNIESAVGSRLCRPITNSRSWVLRAVPFNERQTLNGFAILQDTDIIRRKPLPSKRRLYLR